MNFLLRKTPRSDKAIVIREYHMQISTKVDDGRKQLSNPSPDKNQHIPQKEDGEKNSTVC